MFLEPSSEVTSTLLLPLLGTDSESFRPFFFFADEAAAAEFEVRVSVEVFAGFVFPGFAFVSAGPAAARAPGGVTGPVWRVRMPVAVTRSARRGVGWEDDGWKK